MEKLAKKLDGFAGPENLFVIIALLFGLFIVKILPPMWGADETSHTARVYQLSQGHLMASKDKKGMYGGDLPYNMALLTRYVYNDYYDGKQPGASTRSLTDLAQVDSSEVYQNFERQKPDTKTSPAQFTGAAAYPPVAYLGSLPGVLLARVSGSSLGTIILLGRIGGLIAYILLVYAALKILRTEAERWIVFVIALLPMSLFQASIITADSSTLGLSFLAFASLIRLYRSPKKDNTTLPLLAIAAVTVILVVLIKPTYIFLLVPLLLLPHRLWQISRTAVFSKVCVAAVCLILLGGWAYAVRHVNAASAMSNNQHFAGQISSAEQVKLIVLHPLGYAADVFRTVVEDYNHFMVAGTLGLLGFTYVAIPAVAVVILIVSLVLATGNETVTMRSKGLGRLMPSGFLTGGLLSALAVFTLFYITFTPVGFRTIMGVQGRYFLPVLAFLLYGLRGLVPIKMRMSTLTEKITFPLLSVLALAISYGYYYRVLY